MTATIVMKFEELVPVLEESGRLSSITETHAGPGEVAARCLLAIDSKQVEFLVVLPGNFPLDKPIFQLGRFNALGWIPHVMKTGSICYSKDEGVFLDSDRPEKVVSEALDRAIKTLEDGVSGKNRDDFLNEFGFYWAQHCDYSNLFLYTLFTPEKNLAPVPLGLIGPKTGLVGKSEEHVTSTLKKMFRGKASKPIFQRAIYLSLPDCIEITPPEFGQFWQIEDLRCLLRQLSERTLQRFRSLLKRTPKDDTILLFKLKAPDGNLSVFGLKFARAKQRYRSSQTVSSFLASLSGQLTPVVVQRLEESYLKARGGGMDSLTEKRVLLVGCGAVGGHVALQLAKSGVALMTVVDSDDFKVENIYRHAFGYSDGQNPTNSLWGGSKASMLKRSLEAQLPHIDITALNQTIESILKKDSRFLNSFDLVIVAIGNPTIERWINKWIHEKHRGKLPTVFTWLEPHGIGGHSLIVNNHEHGCYECLLKPVSLVDSGSIQINNRASFAEAGQQFLKNIAWCGGDFTPYGSIAASQTANIACSSAIDLLLGREFDNPINSWKGCSETFTQLGYKLSDRFHMTLEQLFKKRHSYKDPSCAICQRKV